MRFAGGVRHVADYDLVFTNQTASFIDSYGPLTIRSGESFESNNLTLKAYNSGDIVLDPGPTGTVSVGTGSASLKFHVMDSQSATASAIIENTNTGTDADGLLIKLGFTASGNANNRFITFLNGSGNIHGKIRSAGTTVSYDANGVDFAEYFTKDSSIFTPGEVVSLGPDGATKTSSAYDSKMIGVVSTAPGFTGGVEGPNKVLVGIVGQVPVLIDPNSQAIQPGDFITSSGNSGRAQKANMAGFMIGKALDSWNPSDPADSIRVFLGGIWADPNRSLAFDESGNLTISGQLKATEITTQPVPSEPAISLSHLASSIQDLSSQVASVSAQLADLQVQSAPAATLSAQLNELTVLGDATISGQLSVSGPTLLTDTNIAGTLTVGLLKFDDLASDISSLTGILSFNNGATTLDEFGNIITTGQVTASKYNVDTSDVLGASVGKAVLPTGTQELTIETTAVSTDSAIFVTPDLPIAVAAAATDSGRFTIRIPTALIEDLTVNWWVIN